MGDAADGVSQTHVASYAERRPPMAKDKNRSGREVRKPKKAKPETKPNALGERIPGKVITQTKQPSN